MATLQTEALTYQARLPQNLLHHAGQYVVIQGTTVAHFSATYESALDWGYEHFWGGEPLFRQEGG